MLPALTPESTTPLSQHSRITPSRPCARQTAIRFTTLPPSTNSTSWARRCRRTSGTLGCANRVSTEKSTSGRRSVKSRVLRRDRLGRVPERGREVADLGRHPTPREREGVVDQIVVGQLVAPGCGAAPRRRTPGAGARPLHGVRRGAGCSGRGPGRAAPGGHHGERLEALHPDGHHDGVAVELDPGPQPGGERQRHQRRVVGAAAQHHLRGAVPAGQPGRAGEQLGAEAPALPAVLDEQRRPRRWRSRRCRSTRCRRPRRRRSRPARRCRRAAAAGRTARRCGPAARRSGGRPSRPSSAPCIRTSAPVSSKVASRTLGRPASVDGGGADGSSYAGRAGRRRAARRRPRRTRRRGRARWP